MTSPKWLWIAFLLALPLAVNLGAQPQARKFSFAIGAGGAIPREDLTYFMTTSPFLRIGFGYRPVRYLQADVGLDVIFQAAGVRDFQDTIIGRINIRDNETLVPFGGRAILPIGPRMELFGGAARPISTTANRFRSPAAATTVVSGARRAGRVAAGAITRPPAPTFRSNEAGDSGSASKRG